MLFLVPWQLFLSIHLLKDLLIYFYSKICLESQICMVKIEKKKINK